jgi:uncharacterized membrane protein YqjE
MIEDSGSVSSDNPRITDNRALLGKRFVPENWLEAIFGLIKARAAILSIEAKDALGSGLAKLIPLLVCLFCLFSAWTLTIAAAIGCLAAATNWEWFQITFVMAGAHLLLALVAWMIAKIKKPAPFPVTRSEFEKDREWLTQLKNQND